MHKSLKNIINIISILIGIWLISFNFNEWLCQTMQRHQLIQLPAMLLIGFMTGYTYRKNIRPDQTITICILIVTIFSIIFWMIPRSIDLAVINEKFNRIMHFNMLIAGFFLYPVLSKTVPEIKIVFLGMMASMLMAGGITLKTYNLLLCSSFTIEQQKQTGLILILVGITLYFFTIFIFLRGLKPEELTEKVNLNESIHTQ